MFLQAKGLVSRELRCPKKPSASSDVCCICKDGDSTSLGNLCLCLDRLTGKKKCSLMFRQHLLCSSVCAHRSCPVTGQHNKEPGSVFFAPSLQVFSICIYFSSYRTAYPNLANADNNLSIIILHPEENRLVNESQNEF